MNDKKRKKNRYIALNLEKQLKHKQLQLEKDNSLFIFKPFPQFTED